MRTYRIIISSLFVITTINSKAQNTFPTTGNAGIGTTAPQGILDINSGATGSIAVFRGSNNYIPTGIRFVDDSYTQAGQVKEWAIWKGGTAWLKGLAFMRYDAVDRCQTGICDTSFFLSDNGNIGIGNVAPTHKLSVTGNVKIDGNLNILSGSSKIVGFDDPVNYYIGQYPLNGASGLDIHWYNGVKFGTRSGDVMQIDQNGNVGIGTVNPSGKLDIYGNAANPTNLILSANYIDKHRWRLNTFDRGTAIDLDFTSSDVSDTQEKVLTLSRSTSGRPEFQLYNDALVANNGSIGIGTATPQYKLDVVGKSSFSDNMAVKGKIESKEIKVTTTPTADFVFEEDYLLPKLEEVEKHIKAKKHLPEIASAKVMEKEGVNIGEFQIKLLQKIEELTLYMIEQDKKLKVQNEEIKKLKEYLRSVTSK